MRVFLHWRMNFPLVELLLQPPWNSWWSLGMYAERVGTGIRYGLRSDSRKKAKLWLDGQQSWTKFFYQKVGILPRALGLCLL
ncbi:MAG: hypothetical protein V3U65_19370 [Granulosicoccaceae bacterium]